MMGHAMNFSLVISLVNMERVSRISHTVFIAFCRRHSIQICYNDHIFAYGYMGG